MPTPLAETVQFASQWGQQHLVTQTVKRMRGVHPVTQTAKRMRVQGHGMWPEAQNLSPDGGALKQSPCVLCFALLDASVTDLWLPCLPVQVLVCFRPRSFVL